MGLSGVHVLFSNTDDPDHGLIIVRLEISGNWVNETLLHMACHRQSYVGICSLHSIPLEARYSTQLNFSEK